MRVHCRPSQLCLTWPRRSGLRKLQTEIDRTLKKVDEGVLTFDGIWNKVHDTEHANQKEKFEADLKKEIKKLQRYRDQIKTWAASSEIKDKKSLMDARKIIEREMERFKVCEKETKTKAFSKEGLGQQPKTDPRERARGEAREWLNRVVDELQAQQDTFEAEIESLSAQKKGKTKPARLTHLEESVSRHREHVTKLETILRLLDNEAINPDDLADAKDLVEDYVERNQEAFDEFADVNDMYESLNLDVRAAWLCVQHHAKRMPLRRRCLLRSSRVIRLVASGAGATPTSATSATIATSTRKETRPQLPRLWPTCSASPPWSATPLLNLPPSLSTSALCLPRPWPSLGRHRLQLPRQRRRLCALRPPRPRRWLGQRQRRPRGCCRPRFPPHHSRRARFPRPPSSCRNPRPRQAGVVAAATEPVSRPDCVLRRSRSLHRRLQWLGYSQTRKTFFWQSFSALASRWHNPGG